MKTYRPPHHHHEETTATRHSSTRKPCKAILGRVRRQFGFCCGDCVACHLGFVLFIICWSSAACGGHGTRKRFSYLVCVNGWMPGASHVSSRPRAKRTIGDNHHKSPSKYRKFSVLAGSLHRPLVENDDEDSDTPGGDTPEISKFPKQYHDHGSLSYRTTSFPAMLTESFLDDGGERRPLRKVVPTPLIYYSTGGGTKTPSRGPAMSVLLKDKTPTPMSLDPTRDSSFRQSSSDVWGIHRQQDFFRSSDDVVIKTRTRTKRSKSVKSKGVPSTTRSSRSTQSATDNSWIVPQFPCTIEQVAEGAAQAIATTLAQQQSSSPAAAAAVKHDFFSESKIDVNRGNSQPLFDPHLLINSLAGERYWQDRRPVRQVADCGRIGIEIDGSLPSIHSIVHHRPPTSFATIRGVSLTLAQKLAHMYNPKGYAVNNGNTTLFQRDDGATLAEATKPIPVVVYLNTIKQALVASEELAIMKRLEYHRFGNATLYDTVSILSLSQNATLPHVLTRDHCDDVYDDDNDDEEVVDERKISNSNLTFYKTRTATRKRKQRFWLNGRVDPSRGIILVVQPTDWNQEYLPPSPCIGAVSRLQRLAAQAAFFAIPLVVISPRFLHIGSNSKSIRGWDQSGYQQSASFGGNEPPNGPTPWLLRDFVPPVYSWVGEAVKLRRPRREEGEEEGDNEDELQSNYFYSEISMVQSILHRQRAWHIFSRRQRQQRRRRFYDEEEDDTQSYLSLQQSKQPNERVMNNDDAEARVFNFEYLASTKSSAGRPTRDVCMTVWQKFASFSADDHHDNEKQVGFSSQR